MLDLTLPQARALCAAAARAEARRALLWRSAVVAAVAPLVAKENQSGAQKWEESIRRLAEE